MNQEDLQNELQEALQKGWKEFKESEDFKILAEFSSFLSKSGFYESDYRNIVPHPAYDNGAKRIGKYFIEVCCKLGIALNGVFPGDFGQSLESTEGAHEERIFKLDGYKDGTLFCTFEIRFSHVHGDFDYPLPPVLSIISVETGKNV